jgi:hypothetical protein
MGLGVLMLTVMNYVIGGLFCA